MTYKTTCQALIALCRRNFSKLDKKDQKIFLLEQERFYRYSGRGRGRINNDQK